MDILNGDLTGTAGLHAARAAHQSAGIGCREAAYIDAIQGQIGNLLSGTQRSKETGAGFGSNGDRSKGTAGNSILAAVKIALETGNGGVGFTGQVDVVLQTNQLASRHLSCTGNKRFKIVHIADRQCSVNQAGRIASQQSGQRAVKRRISRQSGIFAVKRHVAGNRISNGGGISAFSFPAGKLLANQFRNLCVCQRHSLRHYEGVAVATIRIGYSVFFRSGRIQQQVDIFRILVGTQDGLRAGRAVGLADHASGGNGNGAVAQLVGQSAHRHTGKAGPAARPGHVIAAGQADRGGLNLAAGPGGDAGGQGRGTVSGSRDVDHILCRAIAVLHLEIYRLAGNQRDAVEGDGRAVAGGGFQRGTIRLGSFAHDGHPNGRRSGLRGQRRGGEHGADHAQSQSA